MDLYITQEELARALGTVQGVVERRSNQQVLAHTLLSAKEDHLQVTATDQEITVVHRFPAEVARQGHACVHAVHMFQVARNLPDRAVHLVGEDNHALAVDAPPAHFRLVGLPPDEYPTLPAFEASATLTVKSGDLLRIIDRTVFAIPADDQRYGLNGGHLESIEDLEGRTLLRLVTTDGNRLCYAGVPYTGEFGMGRHMLVPRKALLEIKKLLDTPETEVEISFGERAASFRVGSSVLHTRLVDGEFPAYRSVLPQNFQRRVMVNRVAFRDALRRVALEAIDQASTIRMSFADDEVLITSRGIDHGEAKHPVPMVFEGDPIEMGFNVRYFLEVVNCIDEDELVLELGEPLSPCMVRAPGDEDALFIIMPIRLD
jgi:DNA polymerase-3 subunit beta